MKALIIGLLVASLAMAQPPIRGFTTHEADQEREFETRARSIPNPAKIREYLKRMSAEPHTAGSPASKAVAQYALELMKQWGLDARIEKFQALLPYPTVHAVAMTSPTDYVLKLREPAIPEDKDTSDANQIPTFNAYAASGDVTAPVVYVNYGMPDDYAYLKKHGVDVRGKIALARYGKGWRGLKPKLAQEHGAVACLIYSDPRDDGFFQGDPYPKGPYRPAGGVQRGSVVDMALYPGDPLTPGWASVKDAKRLPLDKADSLMKIPVLPISASDAQPLLENLSGRVAPEDWRGSLPITYHIGPGAATVHFKLDFDWTNKPVYNVIAVIPGTTEPEQWVMYGNHHDAWVNGASDPGSGAAALLETARTLATMVQQGWRPKRTILLALWDAEEFGLVGSTEWVEKHAAELDNKLAVYFNTDSSGKGTISASGSHSLEQFMTEVLRDIPDPVSGKSLLDARHAKRRDSPFHLGPLGAGSDYVAFIHHIGVSSVNLGFSGDGGGGVYHSIYDTFRWFTRYSDSDFTYGRALSQLTSTALMRLSGATILPFEFGNLARTIRGYADEIQKQAGKKSQTIEFSEVYGQIGRMEADAKNFEEALSASQKRLGRAAPEKLAHLNQVLYRAERALTRPAGLPGREWYRHQLYAPGVFTGYGAKTLPGVREAVEADRWRDANAQAAILAQTLKAFNAQIEQATRELRALAQ